MERETTEQTSKENNTQKSAGNPEDEEIVKLIFKWSGQEIHIEAKSGETVADLKMRLEAHTEVLPQKQKLMGFKLKGSTKLPTDQTQLKSMAWSGKLMMVGTPEALLLVEPQFDENDVINDLNEEREVEKATAFRPENLNKIAARVKSLEIKQLNEPRPGKKCVVLDIDYTLFDHKSNAESALELMRPFLHEFLATLYESYDIWIWSATSMKWVTLKMTELGVLNNPNYSITGLLDCTAMITIDGGAKYGIINTKPLGVIWGKYPGVYNSRNTVQVDDLRRNFLMNPQNGLRIRPFKNAALTRDTDQELKYLTVYFTMIAKLPDFSQLNHHEWEDFVASHYE